MTIKTLNRKGVSNRQIAGQLGISRNTVAKYVDHDGPPRYNRQEPYKSILDEHRDYLIGRLKEFPKITAERLHRELQSKGFQGSYPTVVNFVRKHRPDNEPQAYERFETEPGEWAQVDWGEFDPINHFGVQRKLYCFSIVLCYSRAQYVEFTVDMTIATLMRCHINAFKYLGGLPQKILYDNMKTVVTEHIDDHVVFNARFLDFAMHYGFEPKATAVNYPEGKGKVERTIGYVRTSFYTGSRFDSLNHINNERMTWLNEVCNRRIHGTTGEKPFDRLAEERGKLQPVRSEEYDICEVLLRKVHKDCYIRFQNNWYSVPHTCVRRTVVVKVYEKEIKIFDGDKLLTVHAICPFQRQFIKKPEHFEGIVRRKGSALARYRERFERYGDVGAEFITATIRERFPNPYYHWKNILELAESYPSHAVKKALERCLDYKTFQFAVFRTVLERTSGNREATAPMITVCGRCRDDLPEVATRPPDYYTTLVPGSN